MTIYKVRYQITVDNFNAGVYEDLVAMEGTLEGIREGLRGFVPTNGEFKVLSLEYCGELK